MVDLFVFLVSQFFNIFLFLDHIVIIGSLTLLKLMFLLLILVISIRFLKKGGEK